MLACPAVEPNTRAGLFFALLRRARLSRSAIARIAEPREAEQHQGPRGWFGNPLDHATEDNGDAKPIDRQINVGSEVAQIDDGIRSFELRSWTYCLPYELDPSASLRPYKQP